MTLELLTVALIVLGAAAAVLRWTWRALSDSPRHECGGCPGKSAGASGISLRDFRSRTGLNQKK
jgi:hypothetical protein